MANNQPEQYRHDSAEAEVVLELARNRRVIPGNILDVVANTPEGTAYLQGQVAAELAAESAPVQAVELPAETDVEEIDEIRQLVEDSFDQEITQ